MTRSSGRLENTCSCVSGQSSYFRLKKKKDFPWGRWAERWFSGWEFAGKAWRPEFNACTCVKCWAWPGCAWNSSAVRPSGQRLEDGWGLLAESLAPGSKGKEERFIDQATYLLLWLLHIYTGSHIHLHMHIMSHTSCIHIERSLHGGSREVRRLNTTDRQIDNSLLQTLKRVQAPVPERRCGGASTHTAVVGALFRPL